MPVVKYIVLLLAVVTLAGAVIDYQSVTWAMANRDSTMPADVGYRVKAHNEPGPNYYYSSNYESISPNGFKMVGYWQWQLKFEPFLRRTGGWVYNPETISLTDVSPELTVIERSAVPATQ
jgi:hypothetical protein